MIIRIKINYVIAQRGNRSHDSLTASYRYRDAAHDHINKYCTLETIVLVS